MLLGIGFKRIKGAPVIGQLRPAAGAPSHPAQAESRGAVVVAVVVVVSKPVGLRLDQHARLAGADEASRALQKKRAASGRHTDAVLVQIRPGDAGTAADPDVIGAVNPGTAGVPVDK